MKIESELLEDHQIKLKVEVDPEPLEAAKRRAARQIAQKAKIPGFRPGKAPYPVVERYVGEETIFNDALELLVDDIYPKAIEQSGIKPYGPGKLENMPSKDPLVFEFVIPLDAEVELGDYSAVRIPYEPKEVPEAEVDQVLENLRQGQAVIEPVDRAAQESDEVTVKLSAERKQDDEGKKVTLIRERSIPIVIEPEAAADEEPSRQEWPFPGFSRQLIGLAIGDEKTLDYTFPEDSSFVAWRGEEAVFHISVENVKSRTLPELDDEFAKSNGNYENLAALRSTVRARLEGQSQEQYDDGYSEKILDTLVSEAKFKYPPQMLDDEIDSLVKRLQSQLARQNIDMDVYLKSREMDLEALRKELAPAAETRLKKYLVIYEIAEKEKVEVKQDEVQSVTTSALSQLYSSMPAQRRRREPSANLVSNLTENVTVDLLVQHTLERLRSIAKSPVASTEVTPPVSEAEVVSEAVTKAPRTKKPRASSAAKTTRKPRTKQTAI